MNSNQKISIYASQFSPRLLYVLGEVFERQLGLSIVLFNSKEQFLNSNTPKISYGTYFNNQIPYISSSGILELVGIHELNINVSTYKESCVFFQTNEKESILPYDVFACIFYMLSRYEEYLPFQTDNYGRFSSELSLAYKNDFLDKPIVQHWIQHIEDALISFYSTIQFNKSTYKFQPTFDIDIAFAYKKRGVKRQLLSAGKDIFELKFINFLHRVLVLLGFKNDPYDTFNDLSDKFKNKDKHALMFFQCGNYKGDFDKSLLLNNSYWRKFIEKYSSFFQIGFHPSYSSNYTKVHFETEINLFKSIYNQEIKHSRQHFLKLKFPHTYRNLLYFGIENDYTMGYADRTGFRAGTCKPFYFYDLELETTTNLMIHPFVIMDGTLKNYLKLNQEESKAVFNNYKTEIKNVGGTMSIVFHNNTFSDFGEWYEWKKLFLEMLDEGDL